MNTLTDANSFLMAGGAKSAKFENPGDAVKGIVEAADVTQQTDLKTGAPKTWDNGDPMMQLVITLQTDLDDEGDDDDGKRKLYLKGSKPETSLGAVKGAIREAGAKGIEIGGELVLQYTGDGEATQRGFNPPKLYRAKYTAPAPINQAAVDDIFGD